MVSKTTVGWMLFVAAMGMMFSLIAVDISALNNWGEALKPVFVGTFIGHIGATITAFVGGKLIPEERDPNARDRVSDKKLNELNTNNG